MTCISAALKIRKVSMSVNLPYSSVVYKSEKRSSNARQCERYRAKKKASVKGGETQATSVMKTYRKAAKLDGVVCGSKALGTFGASYLFSIFQRLGVIKD